MDFTGNTANIAPFSDQNVPARIFIPEKYNRLPLFGAGD